MLIKNDSVPSPEDINWESHELTCCSGFCRCLIAAAAIILFLAVSCVIIGLCTIYVSTHSNDCEGVSLPSDLAAAQKISDDKIKLCYCSANVIASLSNSDIQSYCSNYLTSIYVEEAIQYAIIIVSGLTNFIFGLLVDSFINFTRPKSCSSALLTKTVFYTLFLTINTILLPILLFANIFGFEAANYVSFLTVFSSNVSSFFAVNKLQFYVDYTDVWYHNVSPIFTNYLICDTLLVWIRFILSYTCTDIT